MIPSCGLTFQGARAGGKKVYRCSCGHEALVDRDDTPECARDLARAVAPIDRPDPGADAAGHAALDAALAAVAETPEAALDLPPSEPSGALEPATNIRVMDHGAAPNQVLAGALQDAARFDRVAVLAVNDDGSFEVAWSAMTADQLCALARCFTLESDAVLADVYREADDE